MQLFPTKFIVRHQAKLVFITAWAHVTILDLCYVTYSGPVFLWQKSLQPFTLFIHLTIACLTLFFYFLLKNTCARLQKYKATKALNSTKEISY
ncbi:MAG TPA: hypothetical protein DEO86_08160 [Colwellia sp.]|nr:hypothetical protein [Colwellia sp.]